MPFAKCHRHIQAVAFKNRLLLAQTSSSGPIMHINIQTGSTVPPQGFKSNNRMPKAKG
jgi:hypothetical protein